MAAEPSSVNGTGTDITTEEKRPHPRHPDRWADGTVRQGNRVAMTHGGQRHTPIAKPESSELYQAWLQDLGGPAEATAPQLVVLRRAAEADAICGTAFDYLVRSRESLTSRRVQTAIQTYRDATGVLFRAVALLGLERRQRRVQSLSDALSQEPEHGA